MTDLFTEHAKELAGLPANWRAYRYECFPKTSGIQTLYYEITGCVCPDKTTGKSKGQPDWRKSERGTKRTVVLVKSEHLAWVEGWERKTGKCSECTGSGQTVASCSVTEGTKYRTCQKCHGSGKTGPAPSD